MGFNSFDNIAYEYIPVLVIEDGIDVHEIKAFDNMTVSGWWISILFLIKM